MPRNHSPSGAETSPPHPLLIRGATLLDGRAIDVRVTDGVIAALSPSLSPHRDEVVVEAAGGLLLPGLQDHHLHLFATAAADASLHCGPPAITDEAGLRQLLAQQAREGDGWLRGTGFHDSVCPGLDRHWLDGVCPHRPVRIQHRSGMMWVYNTAAVEALGIGATDPLPEGVERSASGALTGRFFNLDDWLGERLPRQWPSLSALSARMARSGITGVTDTGVNNGLAVWQALQAAIESGELVQRVLVMGGDELVGPSVRPHPMMAVGPVKLYLREAALPELDSLTARMRGAHRQGRAVAIHCVTRVELLFALAALREAGIVAGDRIEHASVADDHALDELVDSGLTVVSQPHFIAERGTQYLADVEPDDQPFLYRAAAFLARGIPFAAGSDAPYGHTDPWAAMAAAVARITADGVVMAARERISPEAALALYGGTALRPGSGLRTLAVGQPADLCLLRRPWAQIREDLDARHVVLTLIAGRPVYHSLENPTP